MQLGSEFEHLTANASFKVLLDIIQGLMGALSDPPEHWGRIGLAEQDWELLRDRDFWADQLTQAAQHAHKFRAELPLGRDGLHSALPNFVSGNQ